MKQKNQNKCQIVYSSRYLLTGAVITIVLSGCAGGGMAPYMVGVAKIASPFLPNVVNKTLPYAVQGVVYADSLAEKNRQEALHRQKEQERRTMLASMTPEQRAEFLRKEQEQSELRNRAMLAIGVCLFVGCGNGSPQNSDTQSGEGSVEDDMRNSDRNRAIWARQQAEINRQANHRGY